MSEGASSASTLKQGGAYAKIEEFLTLSKGQKAKALETLIEKILSNPLIYVFGEFLSLPNFQELGPANKHLATLQLFAYDNYSKYKTNPGAYIELSPAQMKKLKMVTIAEGAQREKVLRYRDIAERLDIPVGNVRELEDLIIDCIYNELVQGKLDQLNQQFHVVSVYGRDLRPTDIEGALAKLEAWDKQLQHTQTLFENDITRQCDKAVTDNLAR